MQLTSPTHEKEHKYIINTYRYIIFPVTPSLPPPGWNLIRCPIGCPFRFLSDTHKSRGRDLRIWERHTFEGKPEVHQNILQDLSAPH